MKPIALTWLVAFRINHLMVILYYIYVYFSLYQTGISLYEVGWRIGSDRDHELPAAETCALDEGEDEEFDTVKFQQSKGKRLLNKIKGITSKVQ